MGAGGFESCPGKDCSDNNLRELGDSSAAQGAAHGPTGQVSDTSADGTGDPDLACVVAAWPSLPEPIRAGILALVNAVQNGRGGDS